MWRYLKLHEAFVREVLAGKRGELSLSELKEFHEKQIRFMQHERLVHLIVTMFVATFFLMAFGFVFHWSTWPGFAIVTLLLVLLVAYLLHFFRLENGVQRWYHLSNRIDRELGKVAASYDEKGD
jgi:cell division protein FtsW (lipid II flippase)